MFSETEETLRGVIATSLKVDKDLIQGTSTLADWGGDSLDFIETLFAIETTFDISLPELGGWRELDFNRLAQIVKDEIAKKS